MITNATTEDAVEIKKIIAPEFAYRNFTSKQIEQRINTPNIFVFKKIEEKKIIGFIEIELKTQGFITAIAVKKKYRNKGIGKELLEYAISFLEKKGFEKAILLVKKENTVAKKLYRIIGFEFTKLHNKKIENSIIEVWEKELTYFN